MPAAAPRALLVVLDSVGCGAAADAAAYGDEGADTLGHLFERIDDFALPALGSLGLGRVLGRDVGAAAILPGSSAARLRPQAAGKDTTSGHWELTGAVLERPFATFPRFPDELVAELARRGGVGFLGNQAASGTEILERLGEEHVRSGKPILYTSADSVLQLAAHEEHFGLERLLDLCRSARELLDERGIAVGRVIARPFKGDASEGFRRTGNRHDFSLRPPASALDRLAARGVETVGIGKIHDIFAGAGIARSHPTKSNAEGMAAIERLWSLPPERPQLLFANLVDFDSLYGHRRDPGGYARCLLEFDAWLADFLPRVAADELLLITADHGNDPWHPGSDHTREDVPALALHLDPPLADGVFSDLGKRLEEHFSRSIP